MIDHYDAGKAYTSIAKTTCFPASIAAQMIVSGRIRQKGSLFPEEIFHAELYRLFIDGLKARGVVVTHKKMRKIGKVPIFIHFRFYEER